MSRYGYLLALACLITGCEQDVALPTLQLTQRDEGKPLILAVGSDFLLTLPANPSTGFNWQWAPDHLAQLQCLELHGETAKIKPDKARPGSSGQVRWRCHAKGAGSGKLHLLYARSWESVPPAREFVLPVTLR
ncbi:MAG: protease inhibitor I42 family protein [Aeromonadaceae bacterium]